MTNKRHEVTIIGAKYLTKHSHLLNCFLSIAQHLTNRNYSQT